jgi:hypothetical protein
MPIRHACLRLGFGCVAVLACVVIGLFSAGAQAAEPCPNEALRQELRSGQLPDCRAYELVSPSFKDGADATVLAVSGDGSHVIASALGAFAGTEGEQYNQLGGPAYEFSRTASGWATTPLDPPASRFPALAFRGASRDLTRTLWVLREPSESIEEADLYVREPEGRFVEIGPLIGGQSGPPGGNDDRLLETKTEYVGASADLSDVFISDQESSEFSLYEYVGIGVAKPELVGVDNEGKQISNCGIILGGGAGANGGLKGPEGYNAVSLNGERVFFTVLAGGGCLTPTVNELYARNDRSETVDISEPSSLQCKECQTTARQPAEFQGASEGGSKVFFTTTQELLKGQVSENLYELDFARSVGEQIVLVSKGSANPEVQGVARVSEDGSHVYFVAEGVLTGANREGSSPAPDAHNLYVFDEGRVTFVATLSAADTEDWQTSDERPVQATPDGRFLVFDSGSQVFEYDAQEELLVNVSMGHAASIRSPYFVEGQGANPTVAQSSLAVSSDGSYVLFGSEKSGSGSLSEYHSVGSIANGAVYPIFGNDGKSGFAVIDASGVDVFFQSLESLVAADTNTGEDTYDARIDGGFAEPVGPVGCEGEACQGARSSLPLFGSPGSASVTGGGNLTPVVEPKPIGKPTVKPLTQAQKLANALKACRHKPTKKLRACEKQARRAYGSARKANKSRDRGK